jgi:hypothetical protein
LEHQLDGTVVKDHEAERGLARHFSGPLESQALAPERLSMRSTINTGVSFFMARTIRARERRRVLEI